MSKELYTRLQRDMQAIGLYKDNVVDGLWGSGSHREFMKARDLADKEIGPNATNKFTQELYNYAKAYAWSAKVSKVFLDRIEWTAQALKMPAHGVDYLMSCIAWESGETFSPSVVNKAGSGATGLIQFMPETALPYFNSASAIAAMTPAQRKAAGIEACKRLAAMTAEDQVNYVYKYFQSQTGKLKNLGDCYMAILWPKGVGKPDDWVLWDEKTMPTTFRQNAGLDVNKDKVITRGECIAKVMTKLTKGLDPVMLRP